MKAVLAVATLGSIFAASTGVAAPISITTAMGNGADTFLRRNSSTNFSGDANIAIKKQGQNEDSNNDRIGVLKFDLSSLAGAGMVGSVTLNLQSGGTTNPTGTNDNSFLAGHVVHLYGIPDGHSEENWNPATLTFANFDFTTGANGNHARPAIDTAINSIDDTMAILLGQFVFPSTPQYQPAGTPLSFSTVPLTQFLATDTNGIVSFILATTTDGPGQVPVIHSAQSTTAGATIPTLVVELGNAPVPEPASLAILTLGLCAASRRSH